jgi:hypothetical protein
MVTFDLFVVRHTSILKHGLLCVLWFVVNGDEQSSFVLDYGSSSPAAVVHLVQHAHAIWGGLGGWAQSA